MITSTANKQVKFVNALMKKTKTRREEDLFVVEGVRMCGEIPRERIHTLFVSENFQKTAGYAAAVAGVRRVEVVSEAVFKALSDTQTPQGVLALVKQLHYTLDAVLKKPALLMILETLQDPGNLGAIIRAGEGAGITGIIMDSRTADIYNPKVIRATMGSILRTPFVYTEDLPQTLAELKRNGIRLYAAHLQGENNYEQEDYTGNTGFLIGNEGSGLSEGVISRADCLIRIPMAGRVESLNAAVAAAVLMYEAARQRRNKIVRF